MQLPAGAVSGRERWTLSSRFKVRTALEILSPPAWPLFFAPGTRFWVGQPWTVSWHQAVRRSVLQGWASLCWAVGLQGAAGSLPSGLWEVGALSLRGHGLWVGGISPSHPPSSWAGCNWSQPTPLSPRRPLHHQKEWCQGLSALPTARSWTSSLRTGRRRVSVFPPPSVVALMTAELVITLGRGLY